jgi:hypothetical protein
MSPKLQRLRAEIASDLRAFKTRVGEMASLPPLTDAERGSLAEAASRFTMPTGLSRRRFRASPGRWTLAFGTSFATLMRSTLRVLA